MKLLPLFHSKKYKLKKANQKQLRKSLHKGVAKFWFVLESGKLTLKDLSKRVNRDISTLSSAVKRARALSNRDVKLAGRMEELKRKLFKFQTSQT